MGSLNVGRLSRKSDRLEMQLCQVRRGVVCDGSGGVRQLREKFQREVREK